ncbi:hypothetical protein BN1723_015507 [Verticillium longisporum]|uniref:Major facilitator superfamily (MFS) profile domain-containing protein n=1 Tax=Verticillium longisporum TaxID=100787 RepID=A0A0G4MZG5_VERLO|nr:hypothetical protein BN1723_015507 [Verticillium longisporum]
MPLELHGLKSADIHAKVRSLIHDLVNIKDETGEFLMTLADGRIIDTKGWNDWEWTHGVGLYGIWKYYELTLECPPTLRSHPRAFASRFRLDADLDCLASASPPPLLAAARTLSSGSLHAGEPMPTLRNIEAGRRAMTLRRQSTHRYHTFPTPPPKTPMEQSHQLGAPSDASSDVSEDDHEETPLPVRQLALLALLSLTEQTALNSISPYLPQMVESFPDIPETQTGLYVGILASSFALAQLSTNLLWGYLSDVVGRKPTMVLGTFMLMGCFVAFGFCKAYWQIIVVHVAMGMLNGNAAVVPTVLGEVTDRSNQSRAFTWLPVIYSLGGITGPAFGGLLVGKLTPTYPYLAPNLISAGLLLFSVVVVGIWFEETLESAHDDAHEAWIPEWLRNAWSKTWGSDDWVGTEDHSEDDEAEP